MADNGNGNGNGNPQPTTSQLIIPASAPAGELVFTNPPQTATSYYKVAPGNLITFGWNTSYILATPTHLTLSAVCEGGNTYPVGPTDGIIAGTATEVVWDIYSYQINHPGTPLPQAICTVRVCDERGFGASRRAGYLSPNSQLKFAVFTPGNYTSIADGWRCTVCSSAMTTASHPVAVSLVVTLLICLLSGFHLLRHNNHR